MRSHQNASSTMMRWGVAVLRSDGLIATSGGRFSFQLWSRALDQYRRVSMRKTRRGVRAHSSLAMISLLTSWRVPGRLSTLLLSNKHLSEPVQQLTSTIGTHTTSMIRLPMRSKSHVAANVLER